MTTTIIPDTVVCANQSYCIDDEYCRTIADNILLKLYGHYMELRSSKIYFWCGRINLAFLIKLQYLYLVASIFSSKATQYPFCHTNKNGSAEELVPRILSVRAGMRAW